MVKRHNYTPSIQYPLRNEKTKYNNQNTLKTGINEIKTAYLNEITSFFFYSVNIMSYMFMVIIIKQKFSILCTYGMFLHQSFMVRSGHLQ